MHLNKKLLRSREMLPPNSFVVALAGRGLTISSWCILTAFSFSRKVSSRLHILGCHLRIHEAQTRSSSQKHCPVAHLSFDSNGKVPCPSLYHCPGFLFESQKKGLFCRDATQRNHVRTPGRESWEKHVVNVMPLA